VDAAGDLRPQRARHRVVFRAAEAAYSELPAMRKRSPAGIQLLPILQLQAEPKLSAVPACGWRE